MIEEDVFGRINRIHLHQINSLMVKVFWIAFMLSVLQDVVNFIWFGAVDISIILKNAVVMLLLILPSHILNAKGYNPRRLGRYNILAVVTYIFFVLCHYDFSESNIMFVIFNVIIATIYYDKFVYIIVLVLSTAEMIIFSLYVPAYASGGYIWLEIGVRLQILFFAGLVSYAVINNGIMLLTKLFEQEIKSASECEQMSREMARLEQLNLVGEMAAGIGHEIRNPMTTVRGFLQILQRKKGFEEYDEFFKIMIDELDRANSIITEFLSLSKNKRTDLEMKNLNMVLRTIYPLITVDAVSCEKHCKINFGNIPDLPLNEKEIRQLILNLTRNGFESMPAGGKLGIDTYMEGDKVVLAVTDQGHGIHPDIIEKLGTPFVTTKEDGTGLGLAVCYSIAARHNATITVSTGPDGTTFLVIFKISNLDKCG